MLSNSTLLLCVSLTMIIAQFSPLAALLTSIGLCASEVFYLYNNQDKISNV